MNESLSQGPTSFSSAGGCSDETQPWDIMDAPILQAQPDEPSSIGGISKEASANPVGDFTESNSEARGLACVRLR